MSQIELELVGPAKPRVEDRNSFELNPTSVGTILIQGNIPASPSSDVSYPANAMFLSQVDGGFDAWAYLASAWIIEFWVWSLPFTYGVFLNWYATYLFKDTPTSLLTLIGTLSTGIMYLSSLLVLPAISQYPGRKILAMRIGFLLCVVGLVGAAFSTKPWHLVLTQGVVYSTGGSLLYYPVSSLLFEWFSEKRGLANGLMYSGTGVGGLVMPFIIQALLMRFGHKTTFFIYTGLFTVFIVPAFRYVRPRLPVPRATTRMSINLAFLRYGPFWVLFMANIVQGLAAFLPYIYIPTFATDLHLSITSGTIALSVMNGASAVGLILLGWLSDTFDLRVTILLSSVGSALSVFLLWGLAHSLAPLVVFSFAYGALALSWSIMWPRFVSISAGDDPYQSSTVMSIFFAGRGIGNVLSAPLSAGLLRPWVLTDRSKSAYGVKGYGPMIVFTGCTLLSSAFAIVYRYYERDGHQTGTANHARRRL